MKLVKMSLAAAVLLGASAFAIDNVKVSGDAKLYYNTNNADTLNGAGTASVGSNGLFDKASSAADTALSLGVTGDLTKGVSFGVKGIAVSTLGLENNLVSNTWTGAHDAAASGSSFGASAGTAGLQVDDQAWVSEMWIAATLGKTTAKLGRMELDTPLAFSEKWSVAANSFDAAVVLNQDIPDTTLVAAWVGKGNGVNALGNVGPTGIHLNNTPSNSPAVGIDGIVGAGANYGTFASDGAYAAALVNNSFKPLTFQAWYYNVVDVANAYWLQADIDCQLVKGVKIGAQYANISPNGAIETTLDSIGSNDNSSAYAFKLGYEGVQNLKVSAAYSKADSDGVLKISNVATDNLRGAQSKLYTEAFWNYGYVGAPDARSWNLTAEYDAGVAKLGAYYTNVSIGNTNAVNSAAAVGGKDNVDMKEVAITATKSFGPLDATLAYVSTDADDQNLGDRFDTVQAYLTLNF